MANLVVALMIIGAVYLAAKHIWNAHKQGGCVGCDACSKGCGGCIKLQMPKMQPKK